MLTSSLLALAVSQMPISITRARIVYGTHAIAVAPAPTGSRFAVSMEDTSVKVMDAATGYTLLTLKGHPQPAYAVAFNPHGTIIATGDETARIWLWDAKTGKKLKEFDRNTGHQRGIQNLSFNKDGTLLASTGKDDIIILWNVAKGKPALKLYGKGSNFYGAVCNPAGGTLVTATIGEGARIYKLTDPNPVAKLVGHDGQGALDVSVNRVGSVAVTAGKDTKGTVWSLVTKKKMGTLVGHEDFVVRTAFAPNGKIVATASSDRSVRVWSLANFKSIAKIADQCFVGAPVCFTGDGKFLISATDSDAVQINVVQPPQGLGAQPRTPPSRTKKTLAPLGTKKKGGGG